jgi:hypothetical protein
MSDLRPRLERLGERAKAAPDAFEQLERARRRHERNRRITAGVVALLVAVAGSFAAFSAFREGGGQTIGGGGGLDFFALWPEQTEAGLTAAQEAVDRGDPDLAWRSDPIEVARRFALEELLWPPTVAVEPQEGFDAEIEDVISLDLFVPPGSSCDQIVTDAECPTTRTTVTMRRLGRQDGLWSVIDVHGEFLALPLVAGDVVSSGTTITVPTNLPDGEMVSVGVAFLAACDRRGPDDNVEASGGMLRYKVPAVPEGCAGYLYAMRPATGTGAVAIGSFLLTDAEAVPAIGYLVQEIAAVPVVFSNDAPTDVAVFSCDPNGTISPSAFVVAAQPDGVHIAISNAGDIPVSFSIDGLGGDGVEPGGRKETVWQIPPGEATVSCNDVSDGGSGVASSASLDVVDPNGLYLPAELECASGEAYGSGGDYIEGATGLAGDPVQVARDHVSGLEFDDLIQQAGYPESQLPVIRIVRDGAVVGKVTLRGDGSGGWLDDTVEGCSGAQFGWSVEPTGVSGPMGPTSTAWDALCDSARAGEGNNIHNGRDLHVDGRDLGFDTGCLIAPAGDPLTILFSNLDAGVHMNISIYELTPYLRECLVTGTSPSGKVEHRIFSGEIILGVDEIVYEVGPLEPGAYYFQDDVHPSANGVLVVE